MDQIIARIAMHRRAHTKIRVYASTKPVVVEMIIPYVIEVPKFFTPADVEHQRNESTFCLANDTHKLFGEMVCLCGLAKVKYVREATEQDEQELLPFPEEEDELTMVQ